MHAHVGGEAIAVVRREPALGRARRWGPKIWGRRISELAASAFGVLLFLSLALMAGGNLAAVVSLMCRDRGGHLPIHQLLIYPVTNHDFETESYRTNGEGYFLSTDMMRWFWHHYLESEADGANSLASPLRAAKLKGLPPATVITAEYDPLRDEGRAYAKRLAAAGVPTQYTNYDGVFHGFFGIPYDSTYKVIFLYLIALLLVLLALFVINRLMRMPIGRAWEALREDEIACRSLGLNPTIVKLSAFTLGATFAGFAGSFFAARQGLVTPESFTFIESAMILAIVVLGGMGSQLGIILAAVVMVLLQEMREFNEYRMLIFGLTMIVMMIWRPQGLLPMQRPHLELKS